MSGSVDTVDDMPEPAIAAIDLVKRFGDNTAVDGVSFIVPPGTVLGLLGPNGAGKTTTVRMMTTLSVPTSGTATVAGFDVLREPNMVRRNMGLTGQVATVDELLTGRENIRMIGCLYGITRRDLNRLSDQLLEQFSIADAADRPVRWPRTSRRVGYSRKKLSCLMNHSRRSSSVRSPSWAKPSK